MDNPWGSWVYSPYRGEILYVGSDYAHGTPRRAFIANAGPKAIGSAKILEGVQSATTPQTNNSLVVAADLESYLIIADPYGDGQSYLVNAANDSVSTYAMPWGSGISQSDSNVRAFPYGPGKVLLSKPGGWRTDPVYAVLDVHAHTLQPLPLPQTPPGWRDLTWSDITVDVYLQEGTPILIQFAIIATDDDSAAMVYFKAGDTVYYGGSSDDRTPTNGHDEWTNPAHPNWYENSSFSAQQYVGTALLGGRCMAKPLLRGGRT